MTHREAVIAVEGVATHLEEAKKLLDTMIPTIPGVVDANIGWIINRLDDTRDDLGDIFNNCIHVPAGDENEQCAYERARS